MAAVMVEAAGGIIGFLVGVLTNVLSDLVPRTWLGSPGGVIRLLGGVGLAIVTLVGLRRLMKRPRTWLFGWPRRWWGRSLAVLGAAALVAVGVFVGTRVRLNDACIELRIASSFGQTGRDLAMAYRRDGSRVKGRCVAVRFLRDEPSGVTLQRLATGWQPSDGPFPDAWWPSASSFVDLLRAELRANRQDDRALFAGPPVPVVRSPEVIAMPRHMAETLGWPEQETTPGSFSSSIGWDDLLQLARDPHGWGAYGHPAWGPFKLGKTNPELSPSGLSATLATVAAAMDGKIDYSAASLARPKVRDTLRQVEQSVVHYATSSDPFLENLRQADGRGEALTYMSAVWLDEQAVYAYNRARPHEQLVAIYPAEGMPLADHPLVPLAGNEMDELHRAALADFSRYVTEGGGRAILQAQGFRDAAGGVNRAVVKETMGLLPDARIRELSSPGPDAVLRVLNTWRQLRKRANLLVLIDTSTSMKAPAGDGSTRTRLDAAKLAAVNALARLDATDRVGVWAFRTGHGTDHQELSPITGLGPDDGHHRADLIARLRALQPSGGTPLYAAVNAAYSTVQKMAQPDTINAVVVLTDGTNHAPGPDLQELTARFRDAYRHDSRAGRQVRVFAVHYRPTDPTTPQQPEAPPENALAQITSATGGVRTDATPRSIDSVLNDVMSNF